MRNVRWCVNKIGHVGYCLFQAAAYGIGMWLFMMIGIFTILPSMFAVLRLNGIELTDTFVTLSVLPGVLAGGCFFLGIVSRLESVKGKRRWRRAALAVLPIMCLITLAATIEVYTYCGIAIHRGLEVSQFATFGTWGIASLAAFGQYVLATYIVYWKMRADRLKMFG